MKGLIIKHGALEMIQDEWQGAFEAGYEFLRAKMIKQHLQLQEWRKLIRSLMTIDSWDDNGYRIRYRFIKYNNDKLTLWKDVLYADVHTS